MNERGQLLESVTSQVRVIVPNESEHAIHEDGDLRDLASFDSLAFMELLVWLETVQGIAIPDEELLLENFSSIGKIVDYVLESSVRPGRLPA
ncbi:phosphopantetheine-binding protein [Streptomyces polygonati]|uniref:Phosphopantetheine-binding protein n=1 Tax=Streptomyces polygonati TaxID=1617087 RepID=A0ABV8HTQ9_9ACTN